MAIDIAQVRADTPGVGGVVHFNNCGSSLPPQQVLDAEIDYLRLEAAIGGYEAAAVEADKLNAVYGAAARLLRCSPDEIAFVQSAGQAWWRAFEVVQFEPGDKILTSSTEYVSNALGFLQAKERGVEVEVIAPTPSGEIDLDILASRLDERVKLVALTHIGLSNAMVQPAAEVGRLVADTPALYLLDACQAAGQLALDVDELGCDFLSFTGRKFMRGPRGTGVLYARQSVYDQLNAPTYIDGRSAEWDSATSYALAPTALRFEMGEYHFAGKVGLGVAIGYALDIGIDAIAERNAALSAQLRRGLAGIDRVTVRDQGAHQSGIVTFTVDGAESAAVSDRLRQEHRINTSAPQQNSAQHDLGMREISCVVRAGVHYFNTEDEVDQLVEAVTTVVA